MWIIKSDSGYLTSPLKKLQKCTERQFPPGDVAEVLDSAVTSLKPCCSQNLPIYTEIQKCMGIIRNQILALVPTWWNQVCCNSSIVVVKTIQNSSYPILLTLLFLSFLNMNKDTCINYYQINQKLKLKSLCIWLKPIFF